MGLPTLGVGEFEREMNSMTSFKKVLASGLTATLLAASVVSLSSTNASAQWRGRWGGGWRGGWGPGIAAGALGGLAIGALAAGAYGPYYGAPAYGYPYYGGCYYAPQRVWDGYRWVVRRVEYCR
jgi:hypothetical protein